MNRVSSCASETVFGILRPLGGWVGVVTTALGEIDRRVDSKFDRAGGVDLRTRRL